MATTEAGVALTEDNRVAQLATRAAFLQQFIQAWPLLDPIRVQQTAPMWIQLVLSLIRQYRQRSEQQALDYYAAFRQVETGTHRNTPRPLLEWSIRDRAAQQSLTITGPLSLQSRIDKGMEPAQAARKAFVEVSGSASRHVLEGGRSALVTASTVDELAVGWARVTDSNPCWWCAMLASRGYVYLNRDSAYRTTGRSKRGIGEQYHDHCGCTVEPAFSRHEALPPNSERYVELWPKATKGLHGKAATDAFRRAVQGRSLPDDPINAN